MTLRVAGIRLKPWELWYVGFIVGVALMTWTRDDGPDRGDGGRYQGRNAERWTLHEDDLRRLEDGDTLRAERWHGHEVELSADLVVDADELPEEEPESDQSSE